LKESETASMKAAALVQPMSAPADDAPQKVTLAGLLGPVTLSGFVDTYYSFNFNQPSALGNGLGNEGQFFDNNTQQFSLNAIELVADKAPDATAGGTGRAGYHVGLIYGQAASAINGNPYAGTANNGSTDGTDFNNLALKEAYIDYIAPIGKGLTFTVGKFVTPAGNEVIETNGNWNYSRSILFYYAIPYFHFGINAKYTFNPQWSITGFLVNGWNNSQETNTGKTYGVSLAWTPNKYWAVTENYLAGPQNDTISGLDTGYVGKPNDNWRQLEDAVIAYTPNAKWAFAVNGDYGYGDKTGNGVSVAHNSPAVDWWGAAGYAKYTLNAKAYVAARYEYFSDPQGFAIGFFDAHEGEGTATFAYNLTSEFQTRFEFRDDYSNLPIFLKGTSKFEHTQPIVEVGFIYTFSSANAK